MWLYLRGLSFFAGRSFLLLETTGRSTRKLRLTPLGYIRWGDRFLLQPLHGAKSDWVRNVELQPEITIWLGRGRLNGTAMVISTTEERLRALRIVASSKTTGGLIARRHFSLLLNAGPAALDEASQDVSKAIIVVDVHGLA